MIDMIITVTAGENSPANKDKDPFHGQVRINEAIECARYFSVSAYILDDFPDGKIVYHMDDLKRELKKVITKDDTIFIPNIQEKHLDHKAVALVGISLGIKNTIMYSVLTDIYSPNVHVFTDTIERKRLLEKLFPSQWKDLNSGHFNLNASEYFQKSTWVEM